MNEKMVKSQANKPFKTVFFFYFVTIFGVFFLPLLRSNSKKEDHQNTGFA